MIFQNWLGFQQRHYVIMMRAEHKEREYNVFLKPLEGVKVVSIRGSAKGISQTGRWLGKSSLQVMKFIFKNGCELSAPGIALYHHFAERDVEIEFAQPYTGYLESDGELKVRTLPFINQAACVYHYGPLNEVDYAHQVLLNFVKEHNLQIVDAVRVVYLRYDPKGNPEEFLTETQYPIE